MPTGYKLDWMEWNRYF